MQACSQASFETIPAGVRYTLLQYPDLQSSTVGYLERHDERRLTVQLQRQAPRDFDACEDGCCRRRRRELFQARCVTDGRHVVRLHRSSFVSESVDWIMVSTMVGRGRCLQTVYMSAAVEHPTAEAASLHPLHKLSAWDSQGLSAPACLTLAIGSSLAAERAVSREGMG